MLQHLTALEILCGPYCRPAITPNDIARFGQAWRHLGSLTLSAPADCLGADALAHLTRFKSLRSIDIRALPFVTEVPEGPGAPTEEGAVGADAAGQPAAAAAAAGMLPLHELQQALQDELAWLQQQQHEDEQQQQPAQAQSQAEQAQVAYAAAAAPAAPLAPAGAAAVPALQAARAASADANIAWPLPPLPHTLPHIDAAAAVAAAAPEGGDGNDVAAQEDLPPAPADAPAAPAVQQPPAPTLVLGPSFDLVWLPPTLERLRLTHMASLCWTQARGSLLPALPAARQRLVAPAAPLHALQQVDAAFAMSDQAEAALQLLRHLVGVGDAPCLSLSHVTIGVVRAEADGDGGDVAA